MMTIRFGETEEDVIALHRFLCVVAQPVLLAEIDPIESIVEIEDIVYGRSETPGVAFMAEIDGELVGALGLIQPRWWYSKRYYFTDRFLFTFPALRNRGIGARLLAEAGALSAQNDCDLVITGKLKRRNRSSGRGIIFTSPMVIEPEAVPTMDWEAVEEAVL